MREVKPNYTHDAMLRRVEGVVEMDAVIEADGTIDIVRLTRFLDSDLEQTAIDAVLHWKFAPAMENGKPIRFIVSVELTFTLRGR